MKLNRTQKNLHNRMHVLSMEKTVTVTIIEILKNDNSIVF
jgi:hypothetical protein